MEHITVYYVDHEGNQAFIRFSSIGYKWAEIRTMFDSVGLQTVGCSVMMNARYP